MSRGLAWTPEAWSDYVDWQIQDSESLRRINSLVRAVLRDPFRGVGRPEPLKANRPGLWSRRIDHSNRLVYLVEVNVITVISCRYHY